MKRYDVCMARGLGKSGQERLVVVLQHHHMDDLITSIVAPLFRLGELPVIARLRPRITVNRKSYIIAVDRMGSLPRSQLGPPVTSAKSLHFELSDALNRLFTGF